MAIAETAARKLLRGGGGGGAAVARGVAAAGTVGFGLLDGLWQLISGFFAGIVGNLLSALAGAAHLLVLPFEALWRLLLAAVTGAAGAISAGLAGLWHLVTGFFANLFAAVAGAAHQLVLPFEALLRWLLAGGARAAGAISGLWHLVAGFFPRLFATVAGAVSGLWKLAAGFFPRLFSAASGAISGLWQLVTGFFPHLIAAVAGAAHDAAHHLEAFWRWLQSAAAAALPYVLGVTLLLLLAALVWFCGRALCAAAVGACRALVSAACYFGHGLYHVGVAAHHVVACVLPPCLLCAKWCAAATMRAPGAAGYLISRAAFVANPALYFQILRAAGPVVASAVFCAKSVASAVAAPVAALFRVSVGA